MLLRDIQVAERLGCARSSVWCMALAGTLPRPIKRGKKWSRWPDVEIDLVEQAITRGATDEELKTLARELMTDRTEAA